MIDPIQVTQADRDAAMGVLNHAFRNEPISRVSGECFDDMAEAFARHRLASSPLEAGKRPPCETCGKDVPEVLCPTCAKWWADSGPKCQRRRGVITPLCPPPIPEGTPLPTRPTR